MKKALPVATGGEMASKQHTESAVAAPSVADELPVLVTAARVLDVAIFNGAEADRLVLPTLAQPPGSDVATAHVFTVVSLF